MAGRTMPMSMVMSKPQRPPIQTITTGAELRNWYWLKTEIIAHARDLGISSGGQKFDIIDRVAHYLDTGEKRRAGLSRSKPARTAAAGDWHSMPLTRATIIDTGYRNTQNVRRFFKAEIGPRFSFNIEFMAWMKANTSKTLADAVEEWLRIEAERKAGKRAPIPHHNQYNAYMRAYFDANPDGTLEEVRVLWKRKRSLPGHNRYEASDHEIKDD